MEILQYPDPLLRKKSVPFEISTKLSDQEVLDKLRELAKLMFMKDGAGLAAPQVDWHVRLFAIAIPGNDMIIINPVIKRRSIEVELGWEGCLSVPKKRGQVLRSTEIAATCKTILIRDLLRKDDIPVIERVVKIAGKEARCFQHEEDHLSGILYIDRAVKVMDII